MPRGILKRGKRSSTYKKGGAGATRYFKGKSVRFKPGTKRFLKKNARTRAFNKFQFKRRAGKRAVTVKNDKKYKRRQKKINKAISRVLTDMNDDKATMYRQFVPKDAYVLKSGSGVYHGLDGTMNTITNGDYVSVKDPALEHYIKRGETDFFQIDKYHGMIAPSWQDANSLATIAHDNDTRADTGFLSGAPLGPSITHVPSNRIDIRAFKEVELPFLPCIPAHIKPPVTTPYGRDVPHELQQFCRGNNKIKITNNYMRFRFFATPNGQVTTLGGTNNLTVPNINARKQMTGNFTNIEPVFAARTDNSLSSDWNQNDPIHYKITAKRFAKVRIILYERDQEETDQVRLKDFMRYGAFNLDKPGRLDQMSKMPGGNLFVGEEYRLKKRFNSPLKTKRDLPYLADQSKAERLMAGKILMDKTINLKMGDETVFTCNPLAGKVLEYEDSNPSMFTDDGGDEPGATEAVVTVTNESGEQVETTMDVDNADEQTTATGGDHNDWGGLPVDVNGNDDLYFANTVTALNAAKAEYKPINKQYGMFMLMYCQRAGIEYDVFQKFQYDK